MTIGDLKAFCAEHEIPDDYKVKTSRLEGVRMRAPTEPTVAGTRGAYIDHEWKCVVIYSDRMPEAKAA